MTARKLRLLQAANKAAYENNEPLRLYYLMLLWLETLRERRIRRELEDDR